MGLSSSQARLLHLTGRMHQIEYKAAKLEAQKLQMANESAQVYNEYENALEKTKIQSATLNSDGSLDYVDATYNTLTNDGYRLAAGEYMAVTQADIDNFNAADKNPAEFAAVQSGYAVKNGNDLTLASDNNIHLAFTEEQLKTYTTNGNQIVLMDDINVTKSMGTLTSNLDGNGHTINISGGDAIFDSINGSSVKNVTINASIIGKDTSSIGALAKETSGNVTLENIVVDGKIDVSQNGEWASTDVGGLIGTAKDTLTINNVKTGITIDGVSDSGGLIGYNLATVSITNVTADVTLSGIGCGGLVGAHDAQNGGELTIDNCRVNSNINSIYWAGGVLSRGSANISNCYVTGDINSTYDSANPYPPLAAGICANSSWYSYNTHTISNCFIDANMNASSSDPAYGSATADYVLIPDFYNVTNCATPTDANAESVKAAVSSVGNKGGLSKTYNPSGTTNPTTNVDYDHYLEVGKAIESGKYFLIDGHENDNEWLTNLVNNGFVTLQKKNKEGKYYDTSVSVDTHLKEVDDEKNLRKAEAKYEADMKRIDNKDKKYDTDLAALDNERNAIKEEMETLKTVAKDNVERTFRLFS